MRILCIDGNSVLNRAFYAIRMLTTRDGRHTNAIHGFLNIFLKILDRQQPDAVAVAFDLPGKNFRHALYTDYKATRKKMPDELQEQLPVLQELLTAFGYRVVGAPGYEADDLLGTFSVLAENEGWDCIIATGDRDSLQLVSEHTHVLLTTTQFGRGETELIDIAAVERQYGVKPSQLIDVKALMGDSSDNVPGVKGIGEKTALSLIQSFGSLDGVYDEIESEAIKDAVRSKLIAGKESAYLSRELVVLDCEVPLDTKELTDYKKTAGDPARLAAMLASLELKSIASRLSLPEMPPEAKENETTDAARILEWTALSEDALPDLSLIALDVEDGVLRVATETAFFTTEDHQIDRILTNEAIEKVCPDAKKMHHFALSRGVEARGIVFDLSLAAYLDDPSASGYGLERLTHAYPHTPSIVPKEHVLFGSIFPLYRILGKELEAKGMTRLLAEIELPLSFVLAKMERRGFLVDREGIEAFGVTMRNDMQKEEKEIHTLVGRTFNINSPKQLGEALFEDLALPRGRKTKTGYSTDAETLERLSGRHPVIEHILRFRSYGKLYSTYVEGLSRAAGEDGRVHTDFKQTAARTGRISSTNPNLQNIPIRTELGSTLRKFFIAGEEKVLLDADYSQIELRVLASLSNDQRMIEAFSSGRDIHTETAAEIFKLPSALITPELRRRAKAVNFGIVYGIGAFSLSEDIGVSIAEASKYIEEYLSIYDGVRLYLDSTVEQAKKNGYVTTLYGRRRPLPELLSKNKTTQALGRRLAMNTPIQGTAADIIKIAMIHVAERLLEEQLDAHLILQVHDELIVESAKKDAKRAAAILKEEMEQAADLLVHLAVDVGEGENWLDAK